MASLSKRLLTGRMFIDVDMQLINIFSSENKVIDTILYADISKSGWGYIYERHVGQVLSDDGYAVEYNGLTKGFHDGGVDLIAKKGNQDYLIQCKFKKKSTIGKQKIEWILYKASSLIAKYTESTKPTFCLVVPSIDQSFGQKYKKGKLTYPIADYFLSINNRQSAVKFEILEIDMIR